MSVATIALATAFAVTVTLTPLLRRFAHRVGYLDVPGDQSSHERPVPRTGGYAILAGILAAVGAAGGFRDRDIAIMMAAATLLAVVAAIDDFRSLPRFSRFIVQIIVATAIAYEGHVLLRQVALPFGLVVPFGALAGVVTLVWIVGMINAYNFMDGLNGLSSVEGIVCGLALAVLSTWSGDSAGAIAALAVAAACAGFLPWNLPSGSIFMGDVGSASIGFLFALLSLRLANRGVPFVAAALPLLPFLLDSGVTILLRARRGERFFATRHRSHFYQRLNQTGFSHAAVTMIYGLMATLCSAAALAYAPAPDAIKLLLLAGVLAMHVALASWVAAREAR